MDRPAHVGAPSVARHNFQNDFAAGRLNKAEIPHGRAIGQKDLVSGIEEKPGGEGFARWQEEAVILASLQIRECPKTPAAVARPLA